MAKAPPPAEAATDVDFTVLFKKTQLRMVTRIGGGLVVDSVGLATCSQFDARYDVPMTTAPPDAEQPRPEHVTMPKLNDVESMVT